MGGGGLGDSWAEGVESPHTLWRGLARGVRWGGSEVSPMGDSEFDSNDDDDDDNDDDDDMCGLRN